MGGGGSSKSSNTTTTQATDKRMVVDQGIGISSDSSTVTVNSLDAGIVAKALDTVAGADATNGEGFARLLDLSGSGFEQLIGLADKLFTGAGVMIDKTQSASIAQLETINAAASDQRGAIDQKTMVILAVAGAAALVLRQKKG